MNDILAFQGRLVVVKIKSFDKFCLDFLIEMVVGN